MKKSILFFAFFTFVLFAHSQKFKSGCLVDLSLEDKYPVNPLLIKADYILPASVDLSKYFPTPNQQGEYATCVAWAVSYYGRTMIESSQKGITSKTIIDQNTFSPSWIYEQTKTRDDVNCEKGILIQDALNIIRDKGCAKFKDLPYGCSISIPVDVITKASQNKIKDYEHLFTNILNDLSKVNKVKKSLSLQKAVIIGLNTPESFSYAQEVWEPSPSETCNRMNVYHALAVVGYDDNKFGGAFHIINSWGKDWADHGYTWIKYKDFAVFCCQAFQINEKEEVKPIVENTIFLKGSLVLKLENDKEMKPKLINNKLTDIQIFSGESLTSYSIIDSYTSGTKFRIYMTNNLEAYVYAISSDLTGKINIIFPYKPSISPYLGYKNSSIAFPSETAYIRMDKNPGKDYLCIFYSKEKLNLDKIIEKMNEKEGTFSDKLKYALGDKFTPKSKIKYSEDHIAFEAGYSGINNYIVPLLLEIPHQ